MGHYKRHSSFRIPKQRDPNSPHTRTTSSTGFLLEPVTLPAPESGSPSSLRARRRASSQASSYTFPADFGQPAASPSAAAGPQLTEGGIAVVRKAISIRSLPPSTDDRAPATPDAPASPISEKTRARARLAAEYIELAEEDSRLLLAFGLPYNPLRALRQRNANGALDPTPFMDVSAVRAWVSAAEKTGPRAAPPPAPSLYGTVQQGPRAPGYASWTLHPAEQLASTALAITELAQAPHPFSPRTLSPSVGPPSSSLLPRFSSSPSPIPGTPQIRTSRTPTPRQSPDRPDRPDPQPHLLLGPTWAPNHNPLFSPTTPALLAPAAGFPALPLAGVFRSAAPSHVPSPARSPAPTVDEDVYLIPSLALDTAVLPSDPDSLRRAVRRGRTLALMARIRARAVVSGVLDAVGPPQSDFARLTGTKGHRQQQKQQRRRRREPAGRAPLETIADERLAGVQERYARACEDVNRVRTDFTSLPALDDGGVGSGPSSPAADPYQFIQDVLAAHTLALERIGKETHSADEQLRKIRNRDQAKRSWRTARKLAYGLLEWIIVAVMWCIWVAVVVGKVSSFLPRILLAVGRWLLWLD